MPKKIIFITASILLSTIIVGHVALAASNNIFFNAQISIPGSDFVAGQEKLVGEGTGLLCDYIVAIYKYAITIIGVFAMLAVAIGGTMWLTAAGNSGRVSEGKSWITGGLLGLVLALGAFIVLSTISTDLITCKIKTIKSITPIAPPDSIKPFAPIYGNRGLAHRQVASDLDDSGQYYCCVIKGDLDGEGLLWDKRILRCATYQAGTPDLAQAKYDANGKLIDGCNYFYSKYSTYGDEKSFIPLYGAYQYFFGNNKLNLEPQEGTSGGVNSATVYPKKCWENTTLIDDGKTLSDKKPIKDLCVALDDPTYCSAHSTGDTCRTSGGNWGYCNGKTCQKCSVHCGACTEDYQCPNQTLDPKDAGEAGVICGNSVTSWSKDGSDCRAKAGSSTEKICDKEFGFIDIFTDECAP